MEYHLFCVLTVTIQQPISLRDFALFVYVFMFFRLHNMCNHDRGTHVLNAVNFILCRREHPHGDAENVDISMICSLDVVWCYRSKRDGSQGKEEGIYGR